MYLKSFIILYFIFCLAACADASPSTTIPSPTSLKEIIETPVIIETSVSITNTPVPSATSTPMATQTSSPTHIPSPTTTPSPTLAPANLGTPIHQSTAIIAPENAFQLAELAHWGRGVINDVAYSENGRWIAVATTTGVYIHDAQDLSINPHFFESSDNVHLVDISLNGDMIAMGLNTGSIELWHVARHERLWAKEGRAIELQFSPDGQALAAARSFNKTSDGVVWNLPDGEILQSFTDLLALQFSADSSRLAIWEYGTLSVYEWPSGELINQTDPILFVEAPEGELDAQGTILSDVQFGQENEPIMLNLPSNSAYGTTGRVEFQQSTNDSLLLSLPPIELLSYPIQSTCNVPLYFADPPSPPQVWQYELLPQAQIVALRYRGIGFGGDDKQYSSIRFHQLDNGQQLYAQEDVNAFAFSPDGETWIAGMQDGRLQIHRITNGEVLQTFDGYESPISNVVISPDNKTVAVEYLDEVKLYQIEDGTLLRHFPTGRVAFSPDGNTMALGYENGLIELHNMSNNLLLKKIDAHTDAITSLVFLHSGDTLVSASMDCQLNVWQVPNGTLSSSLENHTVPGISSDENDTLPLRVWDMFATSDGERLIGKFFSSVSIWHLPDGTIQEVIESQYSIENIALSPQGDFLAAAKYPLRLWQILDSGEVKELWKHDFSPTSVAFSPNGEFILIGLDENHIDENWNPIESVNGAIELCWTQNGEVLHRLSPGTRKVTALAFTPDGRYFVSSSLDGVVRIWGIP